MSSPTWLGYELTCVNAQHDKYYRIIQSGPHVFVRWGRRGADGQTSFKTYSDPYPYTAQDALVAQVNKKITKGYSVQFSNGSSDEYPTSTPTSPRDIESRFLDNWRAAMLEGMTDRFTTWALFRGLLGGATVVPGYRFILDQLEQSTCYKDLREDLVIGKVSYYQSVRRNYSLVYDLGLIEPGDEEVLELAAGFHQREHSRVDSIRSMETARRLHRARVSSVSTI